jgi:predicted permease
MLNDLRYAIRMLLKSPGFTAVAVLSLSLGIAANTTIFSFVNAALFRPAPVEAPGELWQVWRQMLKGGSVLDRFQGLSYPGYAYFRDHNQSFISLAAFDPETPFVSWNREGIGQPPIQCQFVSGNFFNVCRVRMALGRPFDSEEDRQPGANPVVVVVSQAFWKNSLAADLQVVGKTLTVDGVSLTVVGVAPAEFRGLLASLSPDLWAPFMMAPAVLHDPEWHIRTGAFSLFGVGRLKAGVRAPQAEAELTALTRQLEKSDALHNRDFAAAIFPCTMLPTPFRGFAKAFAALLMMAVFLVLVIACANAANLMLARAVSRRREIAVRASIGASRLRLIRLLLTESTLLASLGGGVGLLLTSWFVPALMQLIPPTLPIRPEVPLDIRVFAFTVVVSLLTGILFGLAPAWQGTRVNLAATLKDESVATGVRRSRFAHTLIAGQVAVCLVLLIAGALCLRSLFNAQRVNLGFSVRNRVTAEVNFNDYGYSEEQVKQFNARFLERMAAFSNVQSVCLADFLPLDLRYLGISFNVEGHEPPPGQDGFGIETFNVGPAYFATLGTRLTKGREFTPLDREGAPAVAIINQVMADQFWPGQEPLGRRLIQGPIGQQTSYEVVGVVETGKYRTLDENPQPIVFRSRLQERGPRSTFVVQVRGDPRGTLVAIRRLVQELDPRLSLSRLGTLEQHLALALFPTRTTGLLFGLFGAVAMLLAVSGLFGVIAYAVSQRTHEIGIRVALGAEERDVLATVLRQGMKLTIIGIFLGLGVALAVTRLLRNLLFGVNPIDPIAFTAVPLLLLAVALLACYIPARRAMKIDPMVALRYE